MVELDEAAAERRRSERLQARFSSNGGGAGARVCEGGAAAADLGHGGAEAATIYRADEVGLDVRVAAGRRVVRPQDSGSDPSPTRGRGRPQQVGPACRWQQERGVTERAVRGDGPGERETGRGKGRLGRRWGRGGKEKENRPEEGLG